MIRATKAKVLITLLVFFVGMQLTAQQSSSRSISLFTKGWKFFLGDDSAAKNEDYIDSSWRNLNLPHDWSIELPFDSTSPTGTGGGALRGGVGWYRKSFGIPLASKGKKIFVDFDGVYCNSEVFINGHSLGVRPNGYISFRYELTPYLKYGTEKNIIAVRVDNSSQPNSRWYSGSGIYRNVWLVTVNNVFVDHWGTYVTTPQVSSQLAAVVVYTRINNSTETDTTITLKTTLFDASGQPVLLSTPDDVSIVANGTKVKGKKFVFGFPHLWSVDEPYLYKAVTQILSKGKVVDEYSTNFGIRYFKFDVDKGFSLNGKPMKIFGVCDHHDLGCLGTAVNTRALERQLEILRGMGINGIRTSHNPPAPELLDLADKMGFIVMDEAFDMWKRPKTKYDYHLYWDEWHKKDLEDQVLRDRNHPSVFVWSIGNEISEQWAGKDGKDTSGRSIARELASIIHAFDTTRPITSALDHPYPGNEIYLSGALDLVGFNYHQSDYKTFPEKFPGKKFIATETISALQTRGHYDMPSDSIRRWPIEWDKPFDKGNPDTTCSAYDNVSAPWGSTHEETLKELLKYDFASGMFIWTGFDYIGEPTPYPWPARSSYFGIVDLAGFPKDVYYLYQSLCTDKKVLHIFPHWNWREGDSIDVWAYYNHADQVELFLNGESLGVKKKEGDDLHVMWRVKYVPGTIKAVSTKDGKEVLTKLIKTTGKSAKIVLHADRNTIKADGSDLSFVTVSIVDSAGTLVPDANNLIQFSVNSFGSIAGTDNGSETSMESFKAKEHKAFNGLCLAVIQSKGKPGIIRLTAKSEGLPTTAINITVK
ncbi:MAG TPA: beta-galactosidase GalB [Puia sp.]|nr:beta-galactosidase GalB [Puia sp.]